MKKFLALIATASLMFSCSQEEVIPEIEKLPINISMGVQTRANDSTYENGDEVGIYVVNYDGSTAGTLAASGNQVDNMRFEYNDGSWTPDETIYWKDKNTAADFYAYYPYSASANISAHPFSVKADQSDEADFWASDFLWGKATKISPTSSAVPIVTNHSLSRILVDIKPGNGFTEESWAAATKSVKICNVKASATIDLSTGIATATGNNGEIIPLATAVNSTANSYKAMMIPQEVADNSKLIVVTVDGVDYVYRKGFTFKANTQHKFSVTINKSGCNVDVTIGEWNIDTLENEGDAEEETTIPNNQIWYTATAKVEPNASANFGATIVSNEWDSTTGKGVITFDGDVTTLEKGVFSNSNNLTKIIIPNSVTTIGYYVFEYCSNLTNVVCEATNPPTLGDYVFQGVYDVTITVPESVLDRYRSDKYWGQYCILAPANRSSYKVGDLITIADVQGVVYFANDAVVRVVSVVETYCKWSLYNNYASATSERYGAANLATIIANGNINNYPAFMWCNELGDGWYLPAKDELSILESAKNDVNATLRANGFVELSGDYWSSTDNINDSSIAFVLDFANDKWLTPFKNTTNYARAITVF